METKEAEIFIKESVLEGVYLLEKIHDGEEYFVSLINIYREKSQVNLKPKQFNFYPLHVTLPNFKEEERREQINSGRTFVACLRINFLPTVELNSSYEGNQPIRKHMYIEILKKKDSENSEEKKLLLAQRKLREILCAKFIIHR